MIFFDENLVPLTHPKAEPIEWLNAMQDVLSDNFFSNTWSVERGSSRRIVFAFSNKLYISWVYSEHDEDMILQVWENVLYPTHLSHEPHPSPNSYGKWDQETQTWKIDNAAPEIVESILAHTVEKFGDITICLPWEGFLMENEVEEISSLLQKNVPFFYALGQLDAAQQEIIEELVSDEYEEDKKPFALECFVALDKEAIVSPKAWGNNDILVDSGDSWLPVNSPLNKFYQFIQEVEELPNWIVVWDECCAACSHSSIQFIAEAKNISEVSPSIILWGQNAQYQYLADGTISTSLYLDEDSMKELEPIISKYGEIRGLDYA